MLSPSMSANLNGVFSRCLTIWRATESCASSPVPASPMTAKVMNDLAPFSICAVAMRGSARSISAKINDLRRVMREGLISIIAYCPLSFFDFSIDDVAPVHFKYDHEAAHGVRIAGDQADFASLIQFDFAQALASEEDFTAVTDDRLGVQANDGHVADFDVQRRPAHRSDDLDLDSRAGPVFEQFDHPRIGELAVVNQQLFFGARNEFGELSP